MRNIERINLFEITERFQKRLCADGIRIRGNGYPDLTGFEYHERIASGIEVWPYSKRNQANNPQNTVITFFEDDRLLYRNLNRIDTVIANLSLYHATMGFDISPCLESNLATQKAALLVNALCNGLFLANGIQVIPTLRIGRVETLCALSCYPRNICFAYGSLGCKQRLKTLGGFIVEAKLAFCQPSMVIAYGGLSKDDRPIFKRWNVLVLDIPDYQTKTRRRSMERISWNV